MEKMIYKKDREIKILLSGQYRGRKFAILSLGVHPTAYVELKEEEFQMSENYDNYDLDVHGGFTYIGEAYWDKQDNSKYIGWDYAHLGDFSGVFLIRDDNYWNTDDKQWTTEEIFKEVISVIEQFEIAEWIDTSKPIYTLTVKKNGGQNGR